MTLVPVTIMGSRGLNVELDQGTAKLSHERADSPNFRFYGQKQHLAPGHDLLTPEPIL